MTATMDRALLQAILRTDFAAFVQKVFHTLSPGQVFVPSWYVEALVHQLNRVLSGEVTRLIINMPPRMLKSMTASVSFPAFVLAMIRRGASSVPVTRANLRINSPTTFARFLGAHGIDPSFRRPGSVPTKTAKVKSS